MYRRIKAVDLVIDLQAAQLHVWPFFLLGVDPSTLDLSSGWCIDSYVWVLYLTIVVINV
jgi:hypothetical protein